MKTMTKTAILISLFFAFSFNGFAQQDRYALIIMDMQPFFSSTGGTMHTEKNEEILKAILEKQVETIQLAIQSQIPILIVEYIDSGDTHQQITNAVDNYSHTKTFIKQDNNIFSNDNPTKGEIIAYLKKYSATNLIITGANGDYCIKDSIAGALDQETYNVIAFSNAIADFSYPHFLYPYDDMLSFDDNDQFLEIDTIEELALLLNPSIEENTKI